MTWSNSGAVGVIAVLLVGMSVDSGAADVPRTGRYVATYTENHPLSEWNTFVDRVGPAWGLQKGSVEGGTSPYRISEEPFDVYVPKSYDGSAPYGLIAYVSPGNGGGPSGDYAQVCDEHKLMWVGGTKISNDRDSTCRARLTVDAVHNMAKIYRIDPSRIYVAGQSGGGRVASHIGVPYADVFTGGAIFIIGCNALVMPSDAAVAKRMNELAKEHRFAFLTGSDDYNKPGTQQVFAQYQGQKYPQVKYLEQPGLGHDTPSKKYFDEAITFLDAPLIDQAAVSLAAGKTAEAKKRWREAWVAYRAAADCVVAEATALEAKPLLAKAGEALDAEAAKELDKILVAPQATALRAFAMKWPAELPSVLKARAEADRVGGVELDKLTAAKPTASVLRAFLKTWGGYAVSERALAGLDALAKEAWPKVDALKPGAARTKAMLKFAEEWAPTATALSADDTVMQAVRSQLSEIDGLAGVPAKAKRLQALLAEVKGSAHATGVEAALVALSKEAGAKK